MQRLADFPRVISGLDNPPHLDHFYSVKNLGLLPCLSQPILRYYLYPTVITMIPQGPGACWFRQHELIATLPYLTSPYVLVCKVLGGYCKL